MHDTFITCSFAGRLGNQMFEIANVFSQAIKHNREVKLLTKNTTGPSPLVYKDKMFRKLEFDEDLVLHKIHAKYIHATYHYTEYEPYEHIPTVFSGYFQSEKYFQNITETIKWLFEPPISFTERMMVDHPELKLDNTVAIHVRRGDFTIQASRFPLISVEYINTSLDKIPNISHCFILSDDIAWCKEHLHGDNFTFIDYSCPSESIWLMSLCDHFIISNSTFSWWGAYLSKNPNKIVTYPSIWFGPDFPVDDWNSKDVHPSSWMKIPTEYVPPGIIQPV